MNQHTHEKHEPSRVSLRARVGAWLEVGVLVALAAFLAFSYFEGRLRFFLAPEFWWLSPATAVVLVAVAAARVWAELRRYGPECECHEDGSRELPRAVYLVLLAAPIVLALAVNPQGYSSEGRRKRQLSLPPRDAVLERAIDWTLGIRGPDEPAHGEAFALSPEPSVLELVTAVGEGHQEDLEGRFVTVVGQCDPVAGAAEGRFDVFRLVVTCCIADASAVSVEVVPPKDFQAEPRGWVRAGGILRFDSPVDPSLPVIHAAEISKIAEPREPYL